MVKEEVNAKEVDGRCRGRRRKKKGKTNIKV